ncbi:hypothetical protein [Nocardia niigatensis]
MISLLAQQVAETTTEDPWWKPWAVPTGVVTGAIIGGLIAGFFSKWVVARMSPHEKLKTLVEIAAKWPETGVDSEKQKLPGIETVYKSIDLTLGKMRKVDKLKEVPVIAGDAQPAEVHKAEAEIDELVRFRDLASIYAWLGSFLVFPGGVLGAMNLNLFGVAKTQSQVVQTIVMVYFVASFPLAYFAARWLQEPLARLLKFIH